MTSEQLQSARAERWHQKSNPALTAEDAKAWIEDLGLCLFLPRLHFLTSAPSFVEAVLGVPSEVPGREAMENATALMRRLAMDAAVVPLNLFGNVASDQPDFLCSRATLPYVFSLIGGRNWKSGPGMKASPLMTEIWTLLNDGQARTTAEIQTALGRELTEPAVLRALAELWNGLRAIPVSDGHETRWELTQARFAAEMTASQKVAQTTALSALVSLYLDGAVAASSEDIETFLSPLTARSRVREVVNGLLATRQLGLISVGAQPLLHVAGALPEFAEEEPAKTAVEYRKPREERGERKPLEREPHSKRAGAKERGQRPFPKRDFREKREKPFPQRELGDRRERPVAGGGNFPKRKSGDSGRERPGRGREERPWQKRQERPARGEGRRPFRERREDEHGGGRKFGGREFRGEKPRFFRERAGEPEERPTRERGGKKFSGEKKFGGGKKFGDRRKPRFFRERAVEGEARPERERGARPGSERGKERFGNSGRPSFRGEGKRGFSKERKPFGKPGGNFTKKSGKGGFGKPKQGGFKPPFRKRKHPEGEE